MLLFGHVKYQAAKMNQILVEFATLKDENTMLRNEAEMARNSTVKDHPPGVNTTYVGTPVIDFQTYP